MTYNISDPSKNKVDKITRTIERIEFLLWTTSNKSLITDEIYDAYEKELNDPDYDNDAKYKEFYKIDPKKKVPNIDISICMDFKIAGNIVDVERNFAYKYDYNAYDLIIDIFKKNKYDMHLRHIYEYYGSGDMIDVKHIRLHDFIEGNFYRFLKTQNKHYEAVKESDLK
jgi:hypothetical protein